MQKQIISDPFSARREVVQALWDASKGKPSKYDIDKVAADLEALSSVISNGAVASAYAALASLLRIVTRLLLWRKAVFDAQPEADRFLRSAREHYTLWLDEYKGIPAASQLVAVAASIPTIGSVAEVLTIARAVALVPLPIAVFQSSGLRLPPQGSFDKSTVPKAPLVDLTVAFLKFQFDGRPAIELQHLSPSEVHDLEIEVRVSRWPEEQEALLLTPVSVEHKSTYEFPSFCFGRPPGEAPYTLHQRGRAILYLPKGMHARPFEFKYMAEFLPKRDYQSVAVVGHRTLLIDGADVSKFQVCGYPGLDRTLFEIRDKLRRRSGIPQNETADILLLLEPLCSLAGRAVQDAEFPGAWSEAEFQKHVKTELRRNPLIGSTLDEHAYAAGGITDLSFRGIPIELKSERRPITSVDDCEKYFDQTVSYAVAKGKRTSILCVLDTSLKKSSPVPPEKLLGLRGHVGTGVAICVLVIQGNLAKPSALSR